MRRSGIIILAALALLQLSGCIIGVEGDEGRRGGREHGDHDRGRGEHWDHERERERR